MSIESPKNTALTIRRKPALMRHPMRLIMTSVGNMVAEMNLTRIGLLTRPAITPVGNMVTEMRRARLGLPIGPVLTSQGDTSVVTAVEGKPVHMRLLISLPAMNLDNTVAGWNLPPSTPARKATSIEALVNANTATATEKNIAMVEGTTPENADTEGEIQTVIMKRHLEPRD
jgi:acyl CoA:acetate/3-ketoacid CoA transferase alpha subunit